MLFCIIKYIVQYHQFKKAILHSPGTKKIMVDSFEFQLYTKVCSQLKLKGKLDIFTVSYIDSPFTCGIFKRKLYLPSNGDISPDLYEVVLCHELAHIKRFDSLYKLVASVAIFLHWYNPFSYFLFYSLDRSNEFTADYIALKRCDTKLAKDYAALILSLCTSDNKRNTPYFSGLLFNQKYFLKERLLSMKKPITPKKKFPLFILLLLTSLTLSSFSVLGYSSPISVTTENKDTDIFSPGTDFTFTTDNIEIYDNFSVSDTIFVDEFGNIYYDVVQLDAQCDHNFIDGFVQKHEKASDGGCKVTIYEAQRCSKCGDTITGKLFTAQYYPACPHK